MIQLAWQNIYIFLSTVNPLHIFYLSLGLLNGHTPACLVSSLELSPPCNKPFTNRQSKENAALAERPVPIMALQATASPLSIHRQQLSPFEPVCSFTQAAFTFTNCTKKWRTSQSPRRRPPRRTLAEDKHKPTALTF